MDVNALNYCRFSLIPIPTGSSSGEASALIALPNLVESSVADIWELPSQKRLHAAIGKSSQAASSNSDGRSVTNPIGESSSFPSPHTGLTSAGIIMSMHIFRGPSEDAGHEQLRLLCAYENGSVTLRGYRHDDQRPSIEGVGWDTLWSVKLHVESGQVFSSPVVDCSVLMDSSNGHGCLQVERSSPNRVRGPPYRAVRFNGEYSVLKTRCYDLIGIYRLL